MQDELWNPPVGVENEKTNKQMKIAINIPSEGAGNNNRKRSQVKVACGNPSFNVSQLQKGLQKMR